MNATIHYHLSQRRRSIALAQAATGLARSLRLDFARVHLNAAYAVWSEGGA